ALPRREAGLAAVLQRVALELGVDAPAVVVVAGVAAVHFDELAGCGREQAPLRAQDIAPHSGHVGPSSQTAAHSGHCFASRGTRGRPAAETSAVVPSSVQTRSSSTKPCRCTAPAWSSTRQSALPGAGRGAGPPSGG